MGRMLQCLSHICSTCMIICKSSLVTNVRFQTLAQHMLSSRCVMAQQIITTQLTLHIRRPSKIVRSRMSRVVRLIHWEVEYFISLRVIRRSQLVVVHSFPVRVHRMEVRSIQLIAACSYHLLPSASVVDRRVVLYIGIYQHILRVES